MIQIKFTEKKNKEFENPQDALIQVLSIHENKAWNTVIGFGGEDKRNVEKIAYIAGRLKSGNRIAEIKTIAQTLLNRDIDLFDYYFETGEVSNLDPKDTVNKERFQELERLGKINRKVGG